MSEAEHLPDSKVKSDLDLAIGTLVDDLSEIYPNLDREKLRERISTCVQEYVPDEDEDAEEEEDTGAGATGKAKGLAKEVVGTVVRNKEMKAEGGLEREGSPTEGNRAYFRNLIEETNSRAAGGA